MLVVFEFLVVFPKDICDLPMERELGLAMVLVTSTRPVLMDFVTGLPNTLRGSDSIWVIVDRMTKSVHFIPIKTSFSLQRLAEIYICNVVKLHGIPD